MNDCVWAVLLEAPSPIFSLCAHLSVCCQTFKAASLAALFTLTPSLQPRWLLSCSGQVLPREAGAQPEWRQNKVILSITAFLLGEVSESLLLFPCRGGPGHIATARLHGLSAELPQLCLPAQGCKGSQFPLSVPSKMTKKSNPKLPSAAAQLILHLPVTWKLGRKISTGWLRILWPCICCSLLVHWLCPWSDKMCK